MGGNHRLIEHATAPRLGVPLIQIPMVPPRWEPSANRICNRSAVIPHIIFYHIKPPPVPAQSQPPYPGAVALPINRRFPQRGTSGHRPHQTQSTAERLHLLLAGGTALREPPDIDNIKSNLPRSGCTSKRARCCRIFGDPCHIGP